MSYVPMLYDTGPRLTTNCADALWATHQDTGFRQKGREGAEVGAAWVYGLLAGRTHSHPLGTFLLIFLQARVAAADMGRGVLEGLTRGLGFVSPCGLPARFGKPAVLRGAVDCPAGDAELPAEALSRENPGVADISSGHVALALYYGLGHRTADLRD